MKLLSRRNLIAGTAALVVAGGVGIAYGTGTVGAQAAPTPTVTAKPAAFMESLAAKLGIPVEKLQAAIQDARTEAGHPGPRGWFGGPGGKGQRGDGFFGGPGGMGGRGDGFLGGPRGMGGWFGGQTPIDTAAKALGITTDQLIKEAPGKSLADLATAHNVDPAKLKADLLAAMNAQVDAAVTAGKITADRAKVAKDNFAAHADDMMARKMPTPGIRGGRMGPFGRFGPAAPTPTAPAKSGSGDATGANA